jgi:hypothetical protein
MNVKRERSGAMRLDYRSAALLALKQHNEDSFADIKRVHEFPIDASNAYELTAVPDACQI